jgi:hypothetical protein
MMVLTLLACGPVPARLDYVEQMSLYDRNLITPSVQVYDADGGRLTGFPVVIAHNSRAGVVQVTGDGFLCLETGESELTLQVGPVEQILLVKCQIVDSLTVEPLTLRVVLERDGEGGWISQGLPPPKVQVLDAAGVSMPELLRAPVVSDDKVVQLAPDGSLRMVGLGRSVLSYTAGGKSVELVVEVGRLVDGNIRLKVPPGGRQILPLKPGLQLVHLSANTPIQATMESPLCGEHQTGLSIRGLECEIGDRGSLIVENPGRSTARVHIELVVFAESGS